MGALVEACTASASVGSTEGAELRARLARFERKNTARWRS